MLQQIKDEGQNLDDLIRSIMPLGGKFGLYFAFCCMARTGLMGKGGKFNDHKYSSLNDLA